MATSQHDTLEEIAKLREELHKERATLQEIRVSESDLQLLCNELEKERNLTAELNKQVGLNVYIEKSITKTHSLKQKRKYYIEGIKCKTGYILKQ